MTDSTELLVLRIALIGVIFVFVLVAAVVLRSGVSRARAPAPAVRRAASGLGRLVVVTPAFSGLEPGAEFPLAGEMTIGRDQENGIVIADASVSGRHASVVRDRGGWRVTDLGSTNGTHVNGRRIGSRGAPLRPGEQLAIGAVILRLQV